MAPPAKPARAGRKSYDEAYFTKWYRDPRTRVRSPEAIRRKIRMVAAVTEYFLGRKLRSVLDIGAGEGAWGVELKRLRPTLHYVGVDPSEYVVGRLGRQRNIRRGSFEELSALKLGGEFDLIICADILQYVPTAALRRGVQHLASLLAGVAYLEAFTTGDEMEGDLDDWHPRSKAQYRRIFAEAGLVGCGMHCYLAPEVAEGAVEMELSD
jgi:SAM-dependent methyltransferase